MTAELYTLVPRVHWPAVGGICVGLRCNTDPLKGGHVMMCGFQIQPWNTQWGSRVGFRIILFVKCWGFYRIELIYRWVMCTLNLLNVGFQSWRRQVYLLQVPHLLIRPVMKSSSEWRSVYFMLLTGEPSINAYFPLIFTCMGSHVLSLGHSSYLLL